MFYLNSFPNIEGKIMKYYKAANQLIFLCCQKGGTLIKNTLDAKGGAKRNILCQEGRPLDNKIINTNIDMS